MKDDLVKAIPIKVKILLKYTTFKDLLEKTTDDFFEDLEPECTSSSCNNESQNFCDCGGSFDEHEIEYVILK